MVTTLLAPTDIQTIHGATLRVLEKTGIKVHSLQARQLLGAAGCRVGDGDLVRIPGHLVDEALRTVPKGFLLYDRDGNPAMKVEGRRVYFGTGVTNPNFLDYRTGVRRPTGVQDIADAARVADYLPNIDWIMPLGSAQDVPAAAADVYEFEAAVSNTSKPIFFIVNDVNGLQDVLVMCEAIAGSREGMVERPFVVSYPEPTSPLVHTADAADKLILSAKEGIPIVYTPCPMSGTSAPVTMAGLLVQTNAECLSGLLMAQLARKGVPFVVGGVLAVMDMRTTMISYGAPEMSLLLAGYADIAHHYGLPVWGTAGCTDAKVPDQQAAIEATFSSVLNSLAGINLIHDPGFLEGAMTGSLEMLVVTDEIVGMVRRFMRGIPVNDETLAEEVIDSVGPGGHYLDHEHTLKYFRHELWQPTLMDRQNYQAWELAGSKTMGQRVTEKIEYILDKHTPKPLAKNVRKAIRSIRERSVEQRTRQ